MENIATLKTIQEVSAFEKFEDECVKVVSKRPVCLSIKMKRPKGCRIRVSSSMLKSNILNSPLLYHFAKENNLEEGKKSETAEAK